MTTDQSIVLALMAAVLALLVSGRIRYDVVAFGALVAAVLLGVVQPDKAFEGFGHPATIIIALVLVVSHGLANSGAISFIARILMRAGTSIPAHIAAVSGLGAALSAVMNNVGALALLMPVDIEAARKAGRSPGLTLMPLSFATILGGLVTLIGTPPNIIVSAYRERALGSPYSMFDFTPVGIVCAVVGVAFVALIGWRLLPAPSGEENSAGDRFALDDYVAELTVAQDSKLAGLPLVEAERTAREEEITVLGVIRSAERLPPAAGWIKLQKGDVLLIEAAADKLDKFAGEQGLEFVDKDDHKQKLEQAELELLEVVVRPGAMIEGRTGTSLQLVDRFGVWLIGISRQGRRLARRVRRTPLEAGDVLLLLAPASRVSLLVEATGVLPLRQRGLEVQDRRRAALAATLFAAAIAASSLGVFPLTIGLSLVTLAYVLTGIVPLRQLYESIEWPVIILIGSLLPIGAALETSGATALMANALVDLSTGLPAWAVLTLVMALTMTLSDVLNNTATAVVTAPVAVEVATRLGVNVDPFLMAVAVASSCAFLTPIGHKNNTLIMGPGGYGFGDYWRLGLPLELIVIAVAVPMILLVWPL